MGMGKGGGKDPKLIRGRDKDPDHNFLLNPDLNLFDIRISNHIYGYMGIWVNGFRLG